MQRRITSKAVDKVNRVEAIQPGQRDRVMKLIEELSEALERESAPDRKGMSVFHVSSTKEVIEEGATASKVDHRRETLIIVEYLPQNTAKEEVAGGDEVTQTRKGDRRLVEFKRVFSQKLAEELGKGAALAIIWLILALIQFLLSKR